MGVSEEERGGTTSQLELSNMEQNVQRTSNLVLHQFRDSCILRVCHRERGHQHRFLSSPLEGLETYIGSYQYQRIQSFYHLRVQVNRVLSQRGK